MNTVMMMNHQKMKISGSDRNSSQRHSKISEWNHVSTWVMLGTRHRVEAEEADAGDPDHDSADTSTQRLSLRLERRTSLSRERIHRRDHRKEQHEQRDIPFPRLPDA